MVYRSNRTVPTQAVVEINQTTLQCTLLAEQADGSPKTFTFDGVYNQGSTTEQIYTDFVYSLVEVSSLVHYQKK